MSGSAPLLKLPANLLFRTTIEERFTPMAEETILLDSGSVKGILKNKKVKSERSVRPF
jgi:hypothetical protein